MSIRFWKGIYVCRKMRKSCRRGLRCERTDGIRQGTTMFGKPLLTLSVGRYIDSTVNAVNREEEKKAAAEHRKPELMESFCPHSMRHTFATRSLERGIPPKVVQGYLGHSTIDVTMNIYTHVTAELEREEIKKLASQFLA